MMRLCVPLSLATLSPTIRALYLASLLVIGKSYLMA